MSLAERVQRIEPSQTLAVTALVAELRREGRDIIDLGAGEPDFETPSPVKEAAITAIREGFTKYTTSSGILELKQAVCKKYETEFGLSYSPAEVLITCGAKHAVINSLQALCESGDEVILPAPYWTSYLEQIRLVDATPVILDTTEESEFKLRPEQLQQGITPRTKLLILNSPCNPTGSAYSRDELAELAEVLEHREVFVLFDEIYEKIVYDGFVHSNLAAWPRLRDRVILVNGVSKSYAMTGWRIGYMVANEEIVRAAAKIQGHSTSNPCSISQKASIAALQADASILEEMVRAFDQRRRFLLETLNGFPGLRCTSPNGAFYLFPNVSRYFGCTHQGKPVANSVDFCSFVLQQEGVAVVPGDAFGAPKHVRISYATSMESLKEAAVRIKRALTTLLNGS